MDAAAQHFQGTIPGSPPTKRREPAQERSLLVWLPLPSSNERMSDAKPREYFIQGITLEGRTFRPSDWAERLAGAMSSFRPGGASMGRAAHIGYSPYCVPQVIHGVRCVVVNEALRELEPMAWDFVMNFARDNQLQVADACLLPEAPPSSQRRPG